LEASPAASPTPPSGDRLNPAESKVLQAAMAGDEAVNEVALPWDHADVVVRAVMLRHIILEKEAGWRLHERGVRMRHFRVVGELNLDNCDVRRPLRFGDCLMDKVSLLGATVTTLTFSGGSVEAIEADRVKAAAIFLRRVTVRGGTRLLGAQVAGDVDFDTAQLFPPPATPDASSHTIRNEVALGLDGAAVGGAFFLRNAVVHGAISACSLTVAKVFDARRLVVDGGGVDLDSAILGADADFAKAQLSGAGGGDGLVLSQARIGGSLRLTAGFQTNRRVMLHDARIAGNLSLREARFVGAIPFAVTAQRMQVDGTFDLDSSTCFGLADAQAADAKRATPTSRLAPVRRTGEPRPERAPGSAFDLTAALVGSLSDQWADWPRGNRVLGFRYKAIAGATSTSAAWWEGWLRLQRDNDLRQVDGDTAESRASGFKPQPWDQAILALRDAGFARDAEDLAIAKEREAHRHDTGPGHVLHGLWGVAAGYGYRPLRLLWALPVIWAISVGLFSVAADRGVMAPTDEKVLASAEFKHCHPEHGGNWTHCALAPAYPDFNAAAYALQTLFPAIEARQSKDWAPAPWVRPLGRNSAAPASAASAASTTGGANVEVSEAEPLPPASGWGLVALWWSWVEATFGLAAPLLVGLVWTGLIQRKTKE
jgi:hypothetical protein